MCSMVQLATRSARSRLSGSRSQKITERIDCLGTALYIERQRFAIVISRRPIGQEKGLLPVLVSGHHTIVDNFSTPGSCPDPSTGGRPFSCPMGRRDSTIAKHYRSICSTVPRQSIRLGVFRDRDPESLDLALRTFNWTIEHMQDASGYFYYQPLLPPAGQQNAYTYRGRSRRCCLRWRV